MKKAVKFLSVLLALMVSMAFMVGCPNGTTDEEEEKEKEGDKFVKGVLTDWHISPGYENTVDPSSLIIEGATETSNGVMKVTWSSSTDFRSCELYALLPNNPVYDYGQYDGITFKVKLPKSSNFLLLLRNPDGGTTVKISESYTYKGRDDAELIWVTVRKPFADAEDSGWGPPLTGTLKEWLTADKAIQKQINLNPILNVEGNGEGGVNTNIVTFFDDIGFYKGADPESPTSEDFIWTFDIE
ncbi:MAG: hypothetical protein LBP76_07470 [Treponema sp.]|jgi:hypothetical protein|nr:hypothetical protein [Treponema sp.]